MRLLKKCINFQQNHWEVFEPECFFFFFNEGKILLRSEFYHCNFIYSSMSQCVVITVQLYERQLQIKKKTKCTAGFKICITQVNVSVWPLFIFGIYFGFKMFK